MAETVTLARPYARAVFERAREQGDYARWSKILDAAATVASDEQVQVLLGSPQVTERQLVDLFIAACGDALDDEGKNLIRVLAENDRLGALVDIAALYEQHRAAAENTIEAEAVSAYPLSESEQAELAKALERRLGRQVKLTTTTDKTLIGGILVRAGDLVIDSTVQGKLAKLAGALSH